MRISDWSSDVCSSDLGENYDANVRAAQTVRDIAATHKAKPGQIALAWLLHKGDDIVPIPGTKRRQYLDENVDAASVTLDDTQMQSLDAALAPGRIECMHQIGRAHV